MLEQGFELLPRLRETEDALARAELLYQLTLGFMAVGLHHEAMVHAAEALEAAQGRGAELLSCRASWALGSAQRELGMFTEAKQNLLEAEHQARALQARDELRDALLGLSQLELLIAQAHQKGGDAAAAASAQAEAGVRVTQALEIVQQPAQPDTPGDALCQLGRCLAACGQRDAAQAVLGDAHSQAVRHGDAWLKLRADAALMLAPLPHTQKADVIELLTPLSDRARALLDHDTQELLQRQLYVARKAMGDLPGALNHLEQCEALQQARNTALGTLQARLTHLRLTQERSRWRATRRIDPSQSRDTVFGSSTLATLDDRRISAESAAIQDPVTGLGNRRLLERELPRLLALCARRQSTLAVAAIALDQLRTVNERFGRGVRNAALKAIADILLAHTRAADLVGRIGPDEFVLVMCDVAGDGAREACERLRLAVQDHAWSAIATNLGLTAAIGLCEQTAKLNAAQMLARADRALYFARNKGGNRIVLADETM